VPPSRHRATAPTRRSLGLSRFALAAVLAATAAAPPLCALDPRLGITQLAHQVWRDELPQATVHSILQSRDGYLWLGTYEGVARFDGVRFVVHDLHRTRELQGTTVLHMVEDRRGRLWLATNGGLTVKEGRAFRTYGTAEGLPGTMVRALLEDPDGSLWVGTDRGLAQLSGDTVRPRQELEPGEVLALARTPDGALWIGTAEGLQRIGGGERRRFGTADGLPSPACRILYVDRAGALWIGTDKGLARWANGAFTVWGVADGLGDDYVRALLEDSDGSLWVGTEGAGLARLRGDRFERFDTTGGLSHDYVRSLFEDREGNLWIGTNGGVTRLREAKFANYGTPEGLSHDFARTVFEDRDGVLWVGTDGGGVSRRTATGWEAITTAQGLSHDAVRAIAQTPDGALWFGTREGLDRYGGGRITPFGRQLPSLLIRALHVDPDGTLWVGAEDGGLARIRRDEVRVWTTRDGLGDDSVRAIHRDRRGRLWIGTYGGGVSRLENGSLTTLDSDDGLPNDIVFAFHEDADGNLWIGTDSGLAVLRDGKLHAFGIDDGLYDEKVFRIFEDSAGNLWMSSNRGIYRTARRDLLAFADGRLSRVPSVGYGRADGMRANQCNGTSQPAGWKTRDGHLWFPTVEGVVEVDPGDLKLNQMPPPVVIEEVRVDGRVVALGRGGALPAANEQLEIDFTGLSFVAPERVTFRYRLEGSDTGWVEAGTRRTAYYTRLPPGSYRFRVVAANNDGFWNERGASLPFTIATPPWRTWWAWLLYILLATGAVYSLVHYRLRSLERANALLEQRVAERTALLDEKVHQLEESERRAHESETRALEASRAKTVFLSNMSHELRTPLNSIIGFSQILEDRLVNELSEKHRRFLSNIHRSGQHLLALINDLLDLSKIEAGRMDVRAEPFDPAAVLHETRELMRGVSAEKGIQIELDLGDKLPTLTSDAGKLRQILLNLLSNAVKFSPAGSTVLVRARPVFAGEPPLLRDGLRVDVVDRGLGIAPADQQLIFEEFRQVESHLARSNEGTGLGLALVRRFLDLLGGAIEVQSAPGEGSTFSVFLPRHVDAARVGRAAGPAGVRPSGAERGDGAPPAAGPVVG
jgi:signal transduction histidine kinase/ligand-binding sensor domain-containing protein